MSVTLAELEGRLWDAAKALHRPVDPADFKTYTFPMLFWQWISDTHDWQRRQAVAEYGEEVPTEVRPGRVPATQYKFMTPMGTAR